MDEDRADGASMKDGTDPLVEHAHQSSQPNCPECSFLDQDLNAPEEVQILKELARQVRDERHAGGLRPRWSVLQRLVAMNNSEVSGISSMFPSRKQPLVDMIGSIPFESLNRLLSFLESFCLEHVAYANRKLCTAVCLAASCRTSRLSGRSHPSRILDGGINSWKQALNNLYFAEMMAPCSSSIAAGVGSTFVITKGKLFATGGCIASFRCSPDWEFGQFVAHIGVGQSYAENIHKLSEVLLAGECLGVASTTSFALARTKDGSVWSWGEAGPWLGYSEGFQHENDASDRPPVQAIPRTIKDIQNIVVVQVACGLSHSLLLSREGDVYTFGACNGENGVLGHGEEFIRADIVQPRLIEALHGANIRRISASDDHNLVVSQAGHLYSWGRGVSCGLGPDLGDCNPDPMLVHTLVHEQVSFVSAGGGGCVSLVATASGLLYSFGPECRRRSMECSSGPVEEPRNVVDLPPRRTPPHPSTMFDALGHPDEIEYKYVNEEYTETSSNGSLRKITRHGWQPQSSPREQTWPQSIRALKNYRIRACSTGENHSVALSAKGTVFTFGSGNAGQLGHGDFMGRQVPRRVSALMGLRIIEVTAGCYHTLALTDTGVLYGFGRGCEGQLGEAADDECSLPCVISRP